jgi:cytoskeletal protein RodZ
LDKIELFQAASFAEHIMKMEKQQTQGYGSSDPDSNSQDGKKDQPFISIGPLLKEERQKRGLSHTKISEITRLRPHIIEALENEAWDRLPSPVFVSGFVRSYGRALGLKEERLMTVFQSSCHVKAASPRPLTEPDRSKKPLLIFLIILLLIAALSFFLWKGYITLVKIKTTPESVSQTEENQTEDIDRSGENPSDPEKGQVAPQEAEAEVANNTPAGGPVPETATAAPETVSQPQTIQEEAAVHANVTVPAGSPGVITEQPLTLKANIREKTWLRIFVDDQEPREYMFMPNEYFVWKGKKGFELLIGNAAGIDLELNGQQIKTTGTAGQVIRLSLPSDYKRKQSQD